MALDRADKAVSPKKPSHPPLAGSRDPRPDEDALTVFRDTAHMSDRDQEFHARIPRPDAEGVDDRLDGWLDDLELQVTGEDKLSEPREVSDVLPRGDERVAQVQQADAFGAEAGDASEAVPGLDLAVVREALLARRADLESLIATKEEQIKEQLAAQDESTQIDFNHPADMVEGDLDYERELSLINRERAELGRLKVALRRIADGSYGVCDACGQAIGGQRLKALPEARFCKSCQDRAERDTRRT